MFEIAWTIPFNQSNHRDTNLFMLSVPLQNNGWDCGVFVCRYAYGLYRLSEAEFTYELAELKGNDNELGFPNLITKSEFFSFDMEDIVRIRVNFQKLIQRLCPIYSSWKVAIKSAQDEAKQKMKASSSTQNVEDLNMNSAFHAVSKETSQVSLASEDQKSRNTSLTDAVNKQYKSAEIMSRRPADCHVVI
jgi:hypothetical protein